MCVGDGCRGDESVFSRCFSFHGDVRTVASSMFMMMLFQIIQVM